MIQMTAGAWIALIALCTAGWAAGWVLTDEVAWAPLMLRDMVQALFAEFSGR